MKICHIANINCVHTQEMVRYFQNLEYEIHLISPTAPTFDNFDELLGRKTICHFVGPIKPGIKNLITYMKIIQEVKKKISDIKPDILHGHYLIDCGFIGAMSKFHPYISFALGSDVLFDPEISFIKKLVYKFVIKKSDIIHCVSEFMREKIISNCKNPEKVELVFPYVDLEVFKPQEKDIEILNLYKLTKKNLIIISNRTLEPLYNVECLIETLPQIINDYPNIRYLILGDGPSKKSLEQMATSLGVKNYVYFIGFIPHQELAQYLNVADIYVSTSLSDGASVSLLEAMACGKPVVVTDIPGNREWVEEGKNGFLFPMKNSNKLAGKLKLLVDNKKLRDEIKPTNCNLIKKKANINNSMRQISKIYMKAKNIKK